MKTLRVRIPIGDNGYIVPVQVPELAEVREYANILHLRNKPYQGQMWDWPVYYEPELVEENASFELPEHDDGIKEEQRSHYSPASFTVGESGIWFFSLLWENGRDAEPVEFLDVVPFEETNFDATAPAAVAASQAILLSFTQPLVINAEEVDEVDQIVDAIGAALDSMSEQ